VTADTAAQPPVTLHVRGSAMRQVDPDFAEINVLVSGRGAEQTAALAQTEQLLAQVRVAIDDHDDIITASLSRMSVTEEFTWDDVARTQVPAGWIGRVSGAVKVGVSPASAVLARLAAAGAQISYVQWGLDPDNPAFREVRGDAVRDTFRAAEDFAAALRRPLGPMLSLADPGAQNAVPLARTQAAGLPMAMSDDSTDIALDPAPITVAADVTAVFNVL